MGVALLYSRFQVGHCIMDGITFVIPIVISSICYQYKKNHCYEHHYIFINLIRLLVTSISSLFIHRHTVIVGTYTNDIVQNLLIFFSEKT